ncbi:MAG: hypothetical protein SGJ07_05250 [Rhodospirillaceae bacterium]|nr:hypothetical protein [Rhodospirillaceae bacterium]
MTGNPPTVRVLLHLARTGGTLISRCLASMAGVAVLSEIHPAGAAIHYPVYDPVEQAMRWYGLVDEGERARLGRTTPECFADAIALIRERAEARGLALVIRDWTQLDYLGAPFRRETAARSETIAALEDRFEIRSFATVRHPIGQWLSLRRIPGTKELTLEGFLAGYRRFAEDAVAMGFVRYEDFTAAPEVGLRQIATGLALPYDPSFVDRWTEYRHMTGDTPAADESTRRIAPAEARPLPPGLVERFAAIADFNLAIGMLGYGQRP